MPPDAAGTRIAFPPASEAVTGAAHCCQIGLAPGRVAAAGRAVAGCRGVCGPGTVGEVGGVDSTRSGLAGRCRCRRCSSGSKVGRAMSAAAAAACALVFLLSCPVADIMLTPLLLSTRCTVDVHTSCPVGLCAWSCMLSTYRVSRFSQWPRTRVSARTFLNERPGPCGCGESGNARCLGAAAGACIILRWLSTTVRLLRMQRLAAVGVLLVLLWPACPCCGVDTQLQLSGRDYARLTDSPQHAESDQLDGRVSLPRLGTRLARPPNFVRWNHTTIPR